MNKKIEVNSFALRQTPESRFSHFEGSWEDLVNLVEENFDQAQPGYKDGVLLVPVPADRFFSGIIHLTSETELTARFESRRKGDDPYVVVTAAGQKAPAAVAEVILYRHDVLDADASSEAEWEVVSINARDTEGAEPLSPMAMARNFLGLPGGTKAEYSAEEFAQAIHYWSTRAMVEPTLQGGSK